MTSVDDFEAMVTPDRPQPVAVGGNRIGSLDFIRGLAVMGILAANIVAMGQPFTAYMYPEAFANGHSEAEGWMWVAQFVLIDGKMRGLFTLLFGVGVYLFMEKAWAKGATRMLQVRRLLWLGLFGAIHFYLIWRGDILLMYAVTGLVAVLFFLDMRAKTQFVLGILLYIAGGIFYGAMTIFMQVVADGPEPSEAALVEVQTEMVKAADEDLADGVLETEIRQDGSYADFVGHTLEAHATDPLFVMFMFAFETLPLILMGLAIYRWGWFGEGANLRKLRLWGWIGLTVGAGLHLWIALATKASGFTYYNTLAAFSGWSHFPRLFMVLGLIALLAVYGPVAKGWLAERVSAAGRAAFTNYLGTSIVMLLVFGNWGLDLFAQLGRTELYLVVLGAWALMLLWSKPWLDRFRYGPLEWLWRCLTYWRVFPIRR